jgi:[pyruvate, water dikinase]-phosphate phosphotransferase / [pyruvate, water dikinase] kinase
VLVGPSRVGKTPLSIYLSVLGWRVANVPLITELPPPAPLLEVDPRRVIGLIIEAGQLVSHRRWRRNALGIPQDSPYTSPSQIYEELDWARSFCRRQGFAVLDVTDRPIESSAEEVIALINRRTEQPPGEPGGRVPAAEDPGLLAR